MNPSCEQHADKRDAFKILVATNTGIISKVIGFVNVQSCVLIISLY